MRNKPLKPNIKPRTGMYREQFYLLNKGDIIRGDRSPALRRVESVHKDFMGRTVSIHLLKLRKSWTTSSYTSYGASDSQGFRPIKVKNDKIWEIDYDTVVSARRKAYMAYYREKAREAQGKWKKLRLLNIADRT